MGIYRSPGSLSPRGERAGLTIGPLSSCEWAGTRHLARASLAGVEQDGAEYWMAPNVAEAEPAAYLLPDYDEFLLGYKDRTASLDPRHSILIVPGANGVFANTLVIDGRVRGTWRRVAGQHGVTIEASPFGRLTAAEKKAFVAPAERFAEFLGQPVSVSWAARR